MKGKIKITLAALIVAIMLISIIAPTMMVFANEESGHFEIMIGDGDTVSGNEVTFSNGYKLEVISDGLNMAMNGTHYETEINDGTTVTFKLTLPDGESVIPDLMISGAREQFSATANSTVYTLENYTVQFPDAEHTVVMVQLDFPEAGGEGEEGGLGETVRFVLDGIVEDEHTINYMIDDKTTVTLALEEAIDSNKEIELALDGETGILEGITVSENFDDESMEVKVWGSNQFNATLSVNNGKIIVPNEVHLPGEVMSLTIQAKSNDSHDDNRPWDQSVYFVWATDDTEGAQTGKFYYSKLDNLAGKISFKDSTGGDAFVFVDQEGNETDGYIINYIKSKDIVADNDPTVKYSVKKQRIAYHPEDGKTTSDVQAYEFIWTDVFEELLNDSSFMALSATERLDIIFGYRMGIDPTSAVSGENSISTNGDRTFRLTIYDDNNYEGLKVGVPSDYKYYPAFWDASFHSDTVDISGTTEENPVIFDTFLLEDTIQIDNDNFSDEIKSIEALNVPNKAVTIKDAGNGKWNITYNSNYYDNVELKITDKNGKVYFVVFARTNLKLNSFWNVESSRGYAEVYYPATDSYKDYEVVCTVEYKDGTSKTTVIETPHKGLQNQGGDDIDAYEIEGGENLKMAWYELPEIEQGPKSNVSKFYLTVVKRNSSKDDVYGGTLAGSGKGIEFKDDGYGFKAAY